MRLSPTPEPTALPKHIRTKEQWPISATRIGAHCIIGGASAVSKDIPPFVMAAGNIAKLYGLNMIGLKRRGFKEETINALKKAYKIIFRSSLLLSVAIERVRQEVEDIPEVSNFIEFIKLSQRGICR